MRYIKTLSYAKHIEFIGEFYIIAETNEEVYIGRDLPSEYSGPVYTKRLRGTLAKAKANASQGLSELIRIAENPKFEENHKEKHCRGAKYVWYRYDTRFALPVFDENGKISRYNLFDTKLLIRHAVDGKKYLYDIMEIKKKRAPRFSISCTVTNPFLMIIILVVMHFINC